MTQELVPSDEENRRAGTGMTTQLRPRPLTPDPQPLPLKTRDWKPPETGAFSDSSSSLETARKLQTSVFCVWRCCV